MNCSPLPLSDFLHRCAQADRCVELLRVIREEIGDAEFDRCVRKATALHPALFAGKGGI